MGWNAALFSLFMSYLFAMRKIYITEEQKRHLKKAIAAQDQVGGKVNAGIMGAVTGMVVEGTEDGETWYRGYIARYGSNHTHVLWLTTDISYARTYGNRVEEIKLDPDRINISSIEEMDDVGNETEEWFDYLDGPSEKLAQEMLERGYNCYCFYANDEGSYCMCLWDESAIISRRELTKEEFEAIGCYDGFDNHGYDDELEEGVEDQEYQIGFEKGGFEPYGHVINEELVYQHGSTPHKALPDFKPNLQPLTMYKQFKLRLDKNGNNLAPGYVFPLYVNTEDEGRTGKESQGLKIGVWYRSGEGECWLDTKNNRLYTVGKGYGTDGNTLSKLAYRPGWHLTTTPWGNQRGETKVVGGAKGTGNNYTTTRNSEVWAKVEICVDIDATEKARSMSTTPADQCLQSLGDREYYRYRTNSNATDDQSWYIVSLIRIVDILDDDTVDATNDKYYADIIANNPGKRLNSDPYTYTKDLENDVPYWKMPRTNGKRYSKEELQAMGYYAAEPTKINESHEWCDEFDYAPYFKSICDFFQEKGIQVEPKPGVVLHRKEQEGLYIKTGYYDPEENEVHLFLADRHPKDVLRSFAHELVHHNQNLRGILGGYKGQTLDGDDTLNKLESEAYLVGNIYFRKWTEELHPVLPGRKQKLNESMQDILNIAEDFDDYGVGKIVSEFFSNKRKGIAQKQWSLIPAQQYHNLLDRYMQSPEMARIPDNIVYNWFFQVVQNVFDLEWMTELCGHSQGMDIDSVRDAIDAEFGEGQYEINDWRDVSNLLESYGFYDWCKLPDGSPACTDYGLQPLFQELSHYKPNMPAGDLLVLLNRVLHVGHVNGDLASAFIEGGSRSCSEISGIVREQAEQPQYFTEDHFKFWNWFGGSKVVDKNGQPLPMYHGTNAEFTAFSKDYFTHGGTAYLGIGFNFTCSDATAYGYGKNVHEVYLRAVNPLTNLKKTISPKQVEDLVTAIDWKENPDGRISTGLLGYRVVDLTLREIRKTAKIIYDYCESDADIYSQFSVCYSGDNDIKVPAAFQELGFDSCIDYQEDTGRIRYVVVFEPNQIKSVNAKNFNPESDEMIDEDFDIGETTDPDDVDLSSFKINKYLNKRFWEGGKLNPEIRLKLMEIADEFIEYTGVKFEPVDIIVTGSIANYNWNQEHSDVDLHIVANFANLSDGEVSDKFLKEYFDDKRRLWNSEHGGITVAGFPVELYVQDEKEPHASSGVYSIEKNRWLVQPSIEKLSSEEMNDEEVKQRVSNYMNEIDELNDEFEDRVAELDLTELYEKADELFKRIRDERKNGFIRGGGEYNNGNIIYKALRRNGYIKKLLAIRTKAYDETKSLLNEK